MAYLSCPSVIINAPVEIVWTILMCPEKSTDVFDLRIVSLEPPGPAVVGQIISGETGPRVWHLTIKLRFVKIDAVKARLRSKLAFCLENGLNLMEFGAGQRVEGMRGLLLLCRGREW